MKTFKNYLFEKRDPRDPKKSIESSDQSSSSGNVSPWTQSFSNQTRFGTGLSSALDAAVSPSMLRWDKPPTPQEFNKNRNMASGLDYAKFPSDYEFLKDTEVSTEGETYLNPNRLRKKVK